MAVAGLGGTVLAVMWIETVIALLFVGLRAYTRIAIVNNVGLDDHLSLISMALFFGYTIFITIAVTSGLGQHAVDLNDDQFANSVKWELMGQTCNILAIATSKSSVAVFLIRIVNIKWHQWILVSCVVSTSLVCVLCILLMFLQCTPVYSIWDPRIVPVVCRDYNFTANAIFSGSFTAGMDFFLAIFPWFLLWKLNMKRKERLTISIGLSLGVFAGIFGIIRAVELSAISSKADYSYATVPVMIWGSTELLVCLLCSTLPGLRPLYRKFRGGSSTDPYSKQNKYLASDGAFGRSRSQQLDTLHKRGMNLSNLKSAAHSTTIRAGDDNVRDDDDMSDERALVRNSAANEFGGEGGGKMTITKTTQVDIAYTGSV